MSAIRIAFVDDHPTLLKGIAALFAEDERYDLCGTAMSADGAVQLVQHQRPDVLLLDLSMPGDVFQAIHTIVECAPKTKIVIFTAYANVELGLRSLDAGAHGFVLKGRPSEELFNAVDSVMAGDLYVSPNFATTLISGFRNRSRNGESGEPARLSAREVQIVDCLFEAMTNKEIARALHLTEKTVKHYMTNLMNKLKVKSRLEVVLAAQELRRKASGGSLDGLENGNRL